MRPWLPLIVALALLLPAAAEAAGMRDGSRVSVFRAHSAFHAHSAFRAHSVVRTHHVRHDVRHAPFRRSRSTRSAADLAPFFGSDFIGDGIVGPVANAAPPADAPFLASLGRLPRPAAEAHATVEVERGVTVVRGPGSRHLLP